MSNFILTRFLKWIGAKFDGKKSYIGAIGKIVMGLMGLALIMFPDALSPLGLPELSFDESLSLILGGYAVFSGIQGAGQRAAIDKVKK